MVELELESFEQVKNGKEKTIELEKPISEKLFQRQAWCLILKKKFIVSMLNMLDKKVLVLLKSVPGQEMIEN